MEKSFFIFILLMLGYISYKNITILSRYKYNKKYIDAYQAVLKDNENAYEEIKNFVNSSKNLEYKSKGNILKLYHELDKDLDYTSTLNSIDYKQLFYKKDKYSPSQLKLNNDSVIFTIMVMAKAHHKKNKDVIKTLADKFNELSGLENSVEYLEIDAVADSFLKRDDSGVSFFNMMLDGGYAGLRYEKNLIGLYKRIASSMLAYNKASMDEYFVLDLSKFCETLIGKNLLKDLGLYKKYYKEDKE